MRSSPARSSLRRRKAASGRPRLGPWHLLLTLAVAASVLAAARFDMGSLMGVGALGSIVWLGTLAVVVGKSASAAVAVIVFGLGLVAPAALVAHKRRPARATPAL